MRSTEADRERAAIIACERDGRRATFWLEAGLGRTH